MKTKTATMIRCNFILDKESIEFLREASKKSDLSMSQLLRKIIHKMAATDERIKKVY